jgi:hypothetical protein
LYAMTVTVKQITTNLFKLVESLGTKQQSICVRQKIW